MLNKRIPLGIDIGRSSVKIVQLLKRGKELKVELATTIEVSANSGPNKTMQNSSLKSSLKGFLQEHNLQGHKAVAALPGHKVFMRQLTLPLMGGDELITVIKYELSNQLPLDREAFTIDYALVEVDEKNRTSNREVLVVATPTNNVMDLVETMGEVGIELIAVDAEPLALFRAYKRCSHQLQEQELEPCQVLIDLGVTQIQLVLIIEGIPRFFRSITYGNNCLNQIHRTFQYVNNQFKAEVGRVSLTGGGSLLKGMPGFLASNLGIKCSVLNPFKQIPCSPGVEASSGALYATSLGLAMRGVK